MILKLYGKTIRFVARAILLSASIVALLIFVIDMATLFSDGIEHASAMAFIAAPIVGFVSYYVSRFFAPPPKENIEKINDENSNDISK